jgi:hypothetical protein
MWPRDGDGANGFTSAWGSVTADGCTGADADSSTAGSADVAAWDEARSDVAAGTGADDQALIAAATATGRISTNSMAMRPQAYLTLPSPAEPRNSR